MRLIKGVFIVRQTTMIAACPYDPSAFPPFAVTVDLVVLTVRRHALCALAVRRGEPPFQGRWALPGGFVRADEDLDAGGGARAGRGDRAARP